ncbi:ABC transporter substrate-binding protein [Tsukamurella sp. PLM1]|uniref:ABC transporter substrate-binding protein n=1 Tax=Tsukamurella sp. PLM1 TaxID=2929795 RepID=UPI002112747C|nr:ABC transporter substrate-binding protein [Tsukamurella sp. PLM1]
MARAVDRADRAEQVIAGVDAHFEGVKKKYPQFAGKRVTFAVYYGPSVGLRFFSGAGSDTEKLLGAMGFAPSPNAEKFVGRGTTVAAEQMSLLDADVLVISDNSNGAIGALTDTAAFKSLPVVAAGQSVVITNNATHTPPDISYAVNGEKKPGNLPWALAQPGPQSTPWAADQVAPVIAAALAK